MDQYHAQISAQQAQAPGATLALNDALWPSPDEAEEDYVSRCPACGDVIDYCRGHGEVGDPAGFAILEAHDDGDHAQCHPDGCPDAPREV